MNDNLIKEKWAELCFVLSENIKSDISERDFDTQVLRAIEILGWSEFKGEIKKKPAIQVGRQGSLIPDIVINGIDESTLIVIEVKRPMEDLTKDESIGQLKSYMRQLKAEFGFLIGRELRVYYDGHLNPQNDPLLLEKVVFDNSSILGWEFVENFNKFDFIEKKYIPYLKKKIGEFNEKRESKKLTDILLSENTKEKIIKFLEAEYADFGKEIFTSVMKSLTVGIFKYNERPEEIKKPVLYRTNRVLKKEENQSFPLSSGTSFQEPTNKLPKDDFYNNIEKLREVSIETHPAFLTVLMDKFFNTKGNYKTSNVIEFMRKINLQSYNGTLRNPWMKDAYGGKNNGNRSRDLLTS